MNFFIEARTFIIAAGGMVGLCLCALRGVSGQNLEAVEWGLIGITAMVAGHAVGKAAAGGGGVAGMWKALTTDAKPDGTKPEV